MCLSYKIKLREDRLQPMATGFHSVFKYFDYEATATAAGGRTEQPQPAVRLQSVALGPVPVFFPVHETGLLNTTPKGGRPANGLPWGHRLTPNGGREKD